MLDLEIHLPITFLIDSTYINDSLLLLLAAVEDYVLGDPWGWLHPVQVMGWSIDRLTAIALKFCAPGWQRRLAGTILGLSIIAGSGFAGWLLVFGCTSIHTASGFLCSIILLASCFAGRSLRDAVSDVLQPLQENDTIAARSRLSFYVGRDTADLSRAEILRALLETVAENAVDGVTAPLFYAVLGSFCGGAVPLALAYKAASTLDSTIGYKKEPYTDLGWFSAQLEDRLTWIPCRLTVLTLSLLSLNPVRVWRTCYRDGRKDPSPNSGWSEAAYAAILNVQLGGKNTYQGVVREKPLLGEALEPIDLAKIDRALTLTRYCFLLWLAVAVILQWQLFKS